MAPTKRNPNSRENFFTTLLAEREEHRSTVLQSREIKPGTDPTDVLSGGFWRCVAALHEIDPRLDLVVGGKPDSPEIVVTANGDPAAFGVVLDLVANAPEIPGFFLRAFRPRLSAKTAPHMAVRYGETTLGMSDVTYRCTLAKTGDCVDLLLGIPGYNDSESLESPGNSLVAGAAVLLLDHVLGEYDSVTRVGELAATGMPILGARTLDTLPSAVDALVEPDVG